MKDGKWILDALENNDKDNLQAVNIEKDDLLKHIEKLKLELNYSKEHFSFTNEEASLLVEECFETFLLAIDHLSSINKEVIDSMMQNYKSLQNDNNKNN